VFAENGTTAWDGTTGLRLTGNHFSAANTIGVFLHAASATLTGNTWADNATDLRQQACDGVAPLGPDDLIAVPVATICPETNVLIAYDLGFDTLRLPSVTTAE
jgi:hypothetical protein